MLHAFSKLNASKHNAMPDAIFNSMTELSEVKTFVTRFTEWTLKINRGGSLI